MKTALAAAGCCAVVARASWAGIIDFESLPASYQFGQTPTGALHSLTLTDTEGVVVTISRSTGTAFDIIDLSAEARPAHWGTRALSPYADTGYGDFIVFSLTPPPGMWVDRVVLEFGDYGTDRGIVKMEGMSGPNLSGNFRFHRMMHWDGNLGREHGTLDSLQWGGGPIGSFVAMGEGLLQNSVFWDNIHLTVLPSPGGAAAIVIAPFVGMRRGRRVLTASS